MRHFKCNKAPRLLVSNFSIVAKEYLPVAFSGQKFTKEILSPHRGESSLVEANPLPRRPVIVGVKRDGVA